MRNKRILAIIVVVGAFLLLWFAWTFIPRIGTATIDITAIRTTPGNSKVSITISRNGEEEKKLELSPGGTKNVRLEKGTVQISAQVGDLRSVDVVEIGKTKELTAPSGEQRKVSRLGTDAFCPLVLTDAIFSYNCYSHGIIMRHTSETGATPLYGGQTFSHLKPVRDGLIGFYSSDFTLLQYFDLRAEKIHRLALPDSVQKLLNESLPQIVSSNVPGSSRFALVFDAKNKVFIFRDISDANPIEITPEVNISDAARHSAPGFAGENFTLFAGVLSHSDAEDGAPNTEKEEQPPNLPVNFYEYNTDGKLIDTRSLGNDFAATGMYKLTENYYEVENFGAFNVYYSDNNNLKPIYKINGVASWTNAQDILYVQTDDGTIYQFVPATGGLFGLHSVFSSDELTVTKVFNSARGLVFTGYRSANQELSDIYQLLNEPAGENEEIPGVAPPIELSFAGLEGFLKHGLTTEQLDATKQAFQNYTKTTDRQGSRVIITNIVPVPHNRFSASMVDTMNFDVTWADETLTAKLEYSDLTNVRLFLFNPLDNAQVFDSQVISGQ